MRKILKYISLLFFLNLRVFGDSGGPYVFVPDLKKDESPPICQIQKEKKKLSFYLTHEPHLLWNKKYNEPTSYKWKKSKDQYAKIEELGTVKIKESKYSKLFAVRYISHKNVNNTYLKANSILVIGSNIEDNELFKPIYFNLGGATTYDFTASKIQKVGDIVYFTIMTLYDGQGQIKDYTHIALKNEKFIRYKLFDESQEFVWDDLNKLGFEPWTRGHWYDVEARMHYHHIYSDKLGHRQIKIEYREENNKLVEKGWNFIYE